MQARGSLHVLERLGHSWLKGLSEYGSSVYSLEKDDQDSGGRASTGLASTRWFRGIEPNLKHLVPLSRSELHVDLHCISLGWACYR